MTEGSGCGPGRQTFHHDSGLLPRGLALQTDGTLAGVPEQRGRFQFYVEMREPQDDPATCAGKRTQKQFTLWVRPPISIALRSGSSLQAEAGVPARVRLRARGGTGYYSWRAIRLPAGFRLRGDGTVVGSPRRAGRYLLGLYVRDTEARTTTWESTLHVAPRLTLRAQRVPGARVGHRYRATLAVRGGIAPRRWNVVRGRLPSGLALLQTGEIAGTPRASGTYRVTVRVRDPVGVRDAALVVLRVDPRR